MKIVLTKRFGKEYLKKLCKYFTKNDFIINIQNQDGIFIHKPFLKLKCKIKDVDFRGIYAIYKNQYIIPLFIFLKKDKKYGENIIWDTHKKLIEKEFELNLKDVKNGDYEVF